MHATCQEAGSGGSVSPSSSVPSRAVASASTSCPATSAARSPSHPHPPGGQCVGRVELAARHGHRLGIAEHDRRRAGRRSRLVQRQPRPPVGHREDEVHVPAARLHVVGHAGHHLDHGEAAVGGRQRAGTGGRDRIGEVEHAQRSVERLDPLG